MRFASVGPEGGLKPYVTVRGRLEALLSRALYYDLVELAVTETRDGAAVLGLWSGGAFFPLTDGQLERRRPGGSALRLSL